MARITVLAVHTDGEPRRWTLSERIVAANLDSGHYVAQLIERLSWATADAEALESPAADLVADHARDARPTISPRRDDVSASRLSTQATT
jgi:hypothetical protein